MDLTPQQQKCLQQLRGRISNTLPENFSSDDELLKWLIARNYDVEKASSMLEKSLEWRKKWNIDSLLSWEAPEVLRKYYPGGMSGFDKEGCPVWIIPYGNCDVKGLLHSTSKRDYVNYTIQVLEKSREEMRKQSAILGRTISYHTVIFDLDHFSLKHFTWKPAMDVVLELIKINEANYPEILKGAIAINAPKIFTAAYTVIKPFLVDETQKKVKIFGKTGWKEAILEMVAPDQLPSHWGGSLKDSNGDPQCPSKICVGGEVPKSYYLKNRKQTDEEKEMESRKTDQLRTLNLPAGEKENFDFHVAEGGSEIRWHFSSNDFDVGFEISKLSSSGEVESIIPQQRVNSQDVPEVGALVCTEAAYYRVTIDNQVSGSESKKLLYDLQLVPKSQIEQTKT